MPGPQAAPAPTLVDVGDATVAVRRWGDPAAPAVLYLQPLGVVGGGIQAYELASALAARGYQVVAYAQPGFAESPPLPPERYRLDALAPLAVGVLDALGVDRAAIVGFSWGGSLAVHVAALAPRRVAALALLDAGHVDATDMPDERNDQTLEQIAEQARAFMREHYTFGDVDAMLADARASSPRWSPAVEAAWRAAFAERDGTVQARLAPETFAAASVGFRDSPPSARLPALAASGIPVLLLLATEPPERAALQRPFADRFAAAVPQAELRFEDGHPHDLVTSIGPPLGDEIADWLAAVGWP